jgi:riboflavin kinase/FMN adenylyltransferase
MRFGGKIIAGQGIGRQLGFPTLNFELAENLKIESGVFAARLFLEEKTFPAILFFGNRETFDNKKSLEIHILEKLALAKAGIEDSPNSAEFEILEKIREVQKFDSSESLKKQIKKDCEIARKILS